MPALCTLARNQPAVVVKCEKFVFVVKTSSSSSTSIRASSGQAVSPKAWFHKKPSGCINGAACKRCHLCPEGEPKLRKKQFLDLNPGHRCGTAIDFHPVLHSIRHAIWCMPAFDLT